MSEVDFDLLADYVGGALAGTPDESRVAALVVSDPVWGAEHAALVTALAATADDLTSFASATAEPMPDEVAARLLAALPASSGVAGAPDVGPARDNRAPRARRPEGGSPPGRPRATAAARRRARWITWAAPAVVAVLVAAFGGLWISQSARDNATVAESAAGGAADSAAVPEALTVPKFSTGTDYDSSTVASGFAGLMQAYSTPGTHKSAAATQAGGDDQFRSQALSPELARLGMAAALAICVDAIAREHGQGPINVTAADFASYQGRPALIVFFTDAASARWGWAVGPDCGPGGTDELFRSRVG
ncbi:hypothetical protein [Asanoa iriomotensis]|uniref:Uncharacterized protein n=1 Tax=Asanoa iriomotensis TaxID=234613 RepID=A0ABQ4C0E8_9ACTN|nr:hypothetical protein [Asanoa iriomotensis]GIF56258.1 hypothetical protein Air01nite_23530 [Asanoa iriomotensis]